MEPSRQLANNEATEARILSTLGPRFKRGDYSLHFMHSGHRDETYHLNVLWQPPEHKVPLGVGALSFNARTGETHVSVHPDHQHGVVTSVLLAGGNKISRLLGGVGLQGTRSTTGDSFKLVKRFLPADSTKITMREPQPPISDAATKVFTSMDANLQLDRGRLNAGVYKSDKDSVFHSCFSCGGNGSDRRWLTDRVWSQANEPRRRENQGMIPADCADCKGSGVEIQGRTPERFIGLG